MISPNYQKILYGLALIGIIITIIMPDEVTELLVELGHFIFESLYELADVSFEWIETGLDTVVEHIFHTELHQTQIIVYYLLVVIAAYPLYYLWRMLQRLFFRLKKTLHAALAAWMLYKTRATLYWLELPLIDKIKLIAAFAGLIYLASLLFF
jgi:hypothetical protein